MATLESPVPLALLALLVLPELKAPLAQWVPQAHKAFLDPLVHLVLKVPLALLVLMVSQALLAPMASQVV